MTNPVDRDAPRGRCPPWRRPSSVASPDRYRYVDWFQSPLDDSG